MSVNMFSMGSTVNEWFPTVIQVNGEWTINETLVSPGNNIYLIRGLVEPAMYPVLGRFVKNGDIIWFDQEDKPYSYSKVASTGSYKDLIDRPLFKGMAFQDDAPDDDFYVRAKGKWRKYREPVFYKWYPTPVEGDFATYCNTYVPKANEGITGILSPVGNKLSLLDYNIGDTDYIEQYVLGKQEFDVANKIAIYYKFPDVPSDFNAIKLACGFYRTGSGYGASPLQQGREYFVDGAVVANEIIIDGIAGITLPSQIRRNFTGSLKNLEFCLVWEPVVDSWEGKLSLYISQQPNVPLCTVNLDDFYIDSISMGLDMTIDRANREVDLSIEILTTPSVIHTGLVPYVSTNPIIPFINEDGYPDDREGRIFEIFGLDKPALITELGLIVKNGDTVWFGSDGKARQFIQSGFSGNYYDLINLPNLSTVALTNSYLDLFDLPHLGTASEKDTEFFADMDAEVLRQAKDYTDLQVDTLNQALTDRVDSFEIDINTKVDTEVNRLDDLIDSLREDLENETLARISEDEQLDIKIDNLQENTTISIALAKSEAILEVLKMLNTKYILSPVITSNYAARPFEIIPVDTSAGAVTVILPATNAPQTSIRFFNYGDTFDINNLILDGQGKNIAGSSNNYIVDVGGASIELLYIDDTYGWMVQ